MFTLTPAAQSRLYEVRDLEGRAGQLLRVRVLAGGCSGFSYWMGWDTAAEPADSRVDLGGLAVVVDPPSAELLEHVELDWVAGPFGGAFEFRNPQATGSCGCGQSFST